ncbi:RING-H2 finger protein ATL54-like [Quercus lobata]|uniref:RING-type E3 ubiquitin transferase n=1 Tax=Quercus lobata TaxID=97700 RepID=A0A7N2MXF5_QUELO|nr:RING-H2 finger protein ATL54-like [Quercus lobata]
MGFLYRKLLDDSNNGSLSPFCVYCLNFDVQGYCPQDCLNSCPSICHYSYPPIPPPSIPSNDQSGKSNKIPTYVIAIGTVLAAAFIIVCFLAIYSRYYLRRRNSRRSTRPQTEETQDEFFDEEEGPIIDHPIWYIRTVGLQPSVISSIRVCKYKRGDGLVEGTECSVCLGEFEEDESLRLLPKCNHAFHLPCIDTWLRSHTNCPMCRAPIIRSTSMTPVPEPEVENLDAGEEAQVEISHSSSESDRDIEEEVCELRIGVEEEGGSVSENGEKRCGNSNVEVNDIQPLRRSVSLDSMSASRISLAVANIVPVKSAGNSETQLVKLNENTRVVGNRGDGNRNLMRLLGSSSKARLLPNRPIFMKRSVSWSGKFKLGNYSQSRNLVLRSF